VDRYVASFCHAESMLANEDAMTVYAVAAKFSLNPDAIVVGWKSLWHVTSVMRNERATRKIISGSGRLTVEQSARDSSTVAILHIFVKEYATSRIHCQPTVHLRQMLFQLVLAARQLLIHYSQNRGKIVQHQYHIAEKNARSPFLVVTSVSRFAMMGSVYHAYRRRRFPAGVGEQLPTQSATRAWKNPLNALEFAVLPSTVVDMSAENVVAQERRKLVRDKPQDASTEH